jgi:cyclopropane fatty-acyl-phospholipid synthase-like methyltransferase
MNKEVEKIINAYIKTQNGKMYAPIPHPFFKNIESIHAGRSNIIVKKISEMKNLYTGLDIGSHWGEMCYVLENLGIKMTAIENYINAFKVLIELRNDCNKNFQVIFGDILDFNVVIKYDIIMALNIFHHFIKTQEKFEKWLNMLHKLDCKVMFFQSHNVKETQMLNSYKNFKPEEFVNIIIENSCLKKYELICDINRPIYVLTN